MPAVLTLDNAQVVRWTARGPDLFVHLFETIKIPPYNLSITAAGKQYNKRAM